MTSPTEHLTHSLLSDDALVVRAEAALAGLVDPWLPLHATPTTRAEPRATIDVTDEWGQTPSGLTPIGGAPLLGFGGVQVHAFDGDVLQLAGASTARGRIDLAAKRAVISVPATVSADARLAFDVYSMLTLSAAFLVGRLGAALVHAGGVVDPDGRAWLLVGDTHAGKTTTCVSLVSAGGWRFLADDQVVLRVGGDGALVAEGWPRRAHLDEGYGDAVVTGTRATVDLRTRWGDRWISRAPLGGVLLPHVNAERSTSLAVAAEAAAFTALVRQSPWLMADRAVAGDVMKLLRDAASHPAFSLSLGRDSYARGDVLAERLGPAVASGVR
ncbi:MAG: hypothetical protein JF589_01350 [Gemmatimonadetes bacterium]|nr:hypothetical protein [Gemmatimonadota bacterium]